MWKWTSFLVDKAFGDGAHVEKGDATLSNGRNAKCGGAEGVICKRAGFLPGDATDPFDSISEITPAQMWLFEVGLQN